MADFEFLRVTPVALQRYLPRFLGHDPAFADMLQTLSDEHETQRQYQIETVKQFFVQTATWGLSDWEQFVGLETNTERTDEERRNDILARLTNPPSVTLDFINRIINLYVTDGTGFAEDHPEDYRIDIEIPEGKYTKLDELKATLEIYVPAHIGLQYNFTTRLERTFTFGGQPALQHVYLMIPPAKRQTAFTDTIRFAGKVVFCRVDIKER
ncbi:DUF2313 domain-containing protein [Megasphaera elsdenii]|uniref:putative phage tail protein n=1 Tax=Megasphaera elsdenii TaxID=907 RepID=UPI0019573921|nr:putative phage tail protein [Megasphaera elsdenii]MBM6701775.1 DUF2313 domain-containing protein [Megasphaera elsdenii]